MAKMRQWSLMTVVVVILVLVGGWFLLVKPQQAQISSVKAEAVTQQQANQVLLQQIVARQGQEKQLPHEQAQLQKLATQVPTVPDEPGIIRNLSASASGAGVNLLSLTPGSATAITASTTPATGPTTLPSTATGQLVELPVSMNVVGSYANLESYFQLLEKLPRALLVTQFSLCPATGGSGCSAPTVPDGTPLPTGSLSAIISADVFFSPTTAPIATGTTTLPTGTSPTTTATTPATTPASPAATTPASPTATAPAN